MGAAPLLLLVDKMCVALARAWGGDSIGGSRPKLSLPWLKLSLPWLKLSLPWLKLSLPLLPGLALMLSRSGLSLLLLLLLPAPSLLLPLRLDLEAALLLDAAS